VETENKQLTGGVDFRCISASNASNLFYW